VDFFLANQISPSVSLDGPKHIHDANRKTRSGKGTFDNTMAGVRLLRANGIKLVGLCVVTATSLEHGREIIDFFLSEGFESLGLIIEEPWGGSPETSLGLAASATSQYVVEEKYRSFLHDIFQAWFPHRARLEIREFQDMFSSFRRLRANANAVTQQEDAVGCKVLSFNRVGDVTTFSPQMIAGVVGDPKRFVVGNIREIQSLDEIPYLPRHVNLQSAISRGIIKLGFYQFTQPLVPLSRLYGEPWNFFGSFSARSL
jgi:uncharacterized protein